MAESWATKAVRALAEAESEQAAIKSGDQGALNRIEEDRRQRAVRYGTEQIDKTFGQFDENFFDTRRQAFLDYALPQLEDQRAKAARELTFALARGGQLEGSVRADQQSELQKMYDVQSRNVADQALAQTTQTRADVEGARSDLLATLNATGDASQAASSAIRRARTLSEPEAYSPLADLFAGFTSNLGAADAAGRARALGIGATPNAAATPTWYNRNSNSVAVT